MCALGPSDTPDDRVTVAVLSAISARSGPDGVAERLGIPEPDALRLLRAWWGVGANLRLAADHIEHVQGGSPFDGRRAQCLMCALWVRDLVEHVRLHGLDLEVYYLAVGLPPHAELVRIGSPDNIRVDANHDYRKVPISALRSAEPRAGAAEPAAPRTGRGKLRGPTPDDALAWKAKLQAYGFDDLDQALESVFAGGGSVSDLARKLQVRVRDLEEHVRWSAGRPATVGRGSIGRGGTGIRGRLASRMNTRPDER